MLKVRDGVKVWLDVVLGELETTFEWEVAEASERWGRERESDWAMIRYVDPEVTVVNGKGDGSDLGRTLREDMIYPAGPSGAVPGKETQSPSWCGPRPRVVDGFHQLEASAQSLSPLPCDPAVLSGATSQEQLRSPARIAR